MNYYDEIKNKLINNEIYEKVKDYFKEKHKVITYFEIGKLLYEAGSIYGENIIGRYAEKLMNEVNKSTLFRMKQFYTIFINEKVAPLTQQLSWSHYIELLPLKDYDEIIYYINMCIKNNLSRNELRTKIKLNEYERLDDSTKLKLITKEETTISDNIKNPIIIKNEFDTDNISEKMLKILILEDIDNFMKELGNGFSYIGNEYKIPMGKSFNYIDLLLFNIEYNAYVVVEFKVTALRKEYIGQIEIYMNYIDKNIKK